MPKTSLCFIIIGLLTSASTQVLAKPCPKNCPTNKRDAKGCCIVKAPKSRSARKPAPTKWTRTSGFLTKTPKGMVKVPGGVFHMGCNDRVDKDCYENEGPGRKIKLGTFYIDKTEVTVKAYGACVRSGKCNKKGLTSFEECNWGRKGRGRHPINCVNWNQAQKYCSWLGKRLPTEAEWEKAARGSDGRKYPWGNQKATCRYAIMSDGCGRESTWPVGSKPAGASPYGALDMSGSVYEWTSDWYSKGQSRVHRGGTWCDGSTLLRASYRSGYGPANQEYTLGFRCAKSP